MTNPRAGFDPVAIVIDWLDACKGGRLQDLLQLYDDGATIECACAGEAFHGRTGVEHYWRVRLDGAVSNAFVIDDVRPDGEGVLLDFHGDDGKAVRIRFLFNQAGQILHTACQLKSVGGAPD